MQKQAIPLFLLLMTLYACHKKAIAQSSTIKNNIVSVKNVIIDPKADMHNTGALYTIDSVKVNGDILSLFVNYSGGCKEHSFELYSNGMYAKSLPPQLTVCLKHTDNHDACRTIIAEEQKFNIAKLKYAGQNTVVIKSENMQPVYYITK